MSGTFNQNTRGKHNTAVQNTGKLELTVNNNRPDDEEDKKWSEKNNRRDNSQNISGHWSTANMTGSINAETVNFGGNNNPSLTFIAVIVVILIALILYHILQK